MKEQFAILPELPIVGTLKLSTRDGISLSSINVVKKTKPSELSPFFRHCFEELQNFLAGKNPKWTIQLDFTELSDFQISVLKEMKKIPYGKVATYKDLAIQLNSKAYQAIGSACGKNPFLLIYPCHRVVGSKDLGGFAHGLEMKLKLMQLETN
jgi:O-6-methylguanine DNA methyltransferase